MTDMLIDQRSVAAYHQKWVVRSAWMFTATALLAFIVSPWLFAQAALFALNVDEHRKRRNRALDRCSPGWDRRARG